MDEAITSVIPLTGMESGETDASVFITSRGVLGSKSANGNGHRLMKGMYKKMNCCVVKLRFYSALHIGDSSSATFQQTAVMTVCADTLFSALCHTALKHDADAGLARLLRAVQNGTLRFSDLLPYRGDTLFAPRPLAADKRQEDNDPSRPKPMVDPEYIPLQLLPAYCSALTAGEWIDLGLCENSFGFFHDSVKTGMHVTEKTEPHTFVSFTFHEDAGLYAAIYYEDRGLCAYILSLLKALGPSGLGGQSGRGCGKFKLDETNILYLESRYHLYDQDSLLLYEAGCEKPAPAYLLMNTALPADDELGPVLCGAHVKLVRRGGYGQSESNAASQLKIRTQYFLAAGSVLRCRFCGGLYEVFAEGSHPVYRLGVPVLMGVNL